MDIDTDAYIDTEIDSNFGNDTEIDSNFNTEIDTYTDLLCPLSPGSHIHNAKLLFVFVVRGDLTATETLGKKLVR